MRFVTLIPFRAWIFAAGVLAAWFLWGWKISIFVGIVLLFGLTGF